ncbi:MAG TPA: hypothetical protein VGC65_00355 [Bacteroidia bacterium]|jgi:hypothetical protein
MYKEQIKNPFTGIEQPFEIDISEQIEIMQFEALKEFIKGHLRCALANEELKADALKIEKLNWLIVQLYEPTTILSLSNKLLKFKEYLLGIKEYNEVLEHLKCSQEQDLTVGDIRND